MNVFTHLTLGTAEAKEATFKHIREATDVNLNVAVVKLQTHCANLPNSLLRSRGLSLGV